MRSVAERRIFCALTATQFFGFGLRDGEFYRRERRGLVRSVAEWLILRLPTRAPPVISER